MSILLLFFISRVLEFNLKSLIALTTFFFLGGGARKQTTKNNCHCKYNFSAMDVRMGWPQTTYSSNPFFVCPTVEMDLLKPFHSDVQLWREPIEVNIKWFFFFVLWDLELFFFFFFGYSVNYSSPTTIFSSRSGVVIL